MLDHKGQALVQVYVAGRHLKHDQSEWLLHM